jgi:epoxyqueuosine reductase
MVCCSSSQSKLTVGIELLKGHLVLSDPSHLFKKIQSWGQTLGFSQIGVARVDLSHAEKPLLDWLEKGFHGEMNYMQRHGLKRARPAELLPGTISVITARMNYLSPPSAHPIPLTLTAEQTAVLGQTLHFSNNPASPASPAEPLEQANHWTTNEWRQINTPEQAYVSLYARGKDYHKSVKLRLEQLAKLIKADLSDLTHRVFCDSAPVMEVELATRSHLGWRGKHTLLLNRDAGSMFFLGEIFVNFDLHEFAPVTSAQEHCGSCTACIDICPTQAIVAPYQLDARRCISYLTIEHPGSIDVSLRPLMGNRVYGCDDCQLICPWNKFAKPTALTDFQSREILTHQSLLQLWSWSEADFLSHTQGSAIRRIGHEKWLRNLAIALGNSLAKSTNKTYREEVRSALSLRLDHPSDLVKEHVRWALEQA